MEKQSSFKMMSAEIKAYKTTYIGLFFVTLVTLMFEILLTRIFSVTMWYHFAFMAISVAIFGMTVGAMIVYLCPHFFTPEKIKSQLALNALGFSITIVISFLTHLCIPFVIEGSVLGIYSIALTYVVITIPFVFSGICVCLALTKFHRDVSRLYAVDLIGAALGCILLIYALKVSDGPTTVFIASLLACIGSLFFAVGAKNKSLIRVVAICGILLAGFIAINTVLVQKQRPLIRLMWVKGKPESAPLYERWNSFSRVRVYGNPNELETPFGWGLSGTFPADQTIRQLHMDIDAGAYTPMSAFDGDVDRIAFLAYDVMNLVHYIRHDARVLVVGTGGGRDILSALLFQQKSVVGVEINENIIDIVNHKYGDFTGHLDRYPQVTFVNDEARSYIARQKEKFDIIQISLIDTWAATASGAFVLTENSLYTLEAWKIFLEHLTARGVLTVSRWYLGDTPYEMYRLISLARELLIREGVQNPRDHMVVVKNGMIGTLLLSRSPFSDEDLNTIDDGVRQMQFELILSPRFSISSAFETLVSGRGLEDFAAQLPVRIDPPSDDNPFFFHMLKLKHSFDQRLTRIGIVDSNMKAIFVLSVLLIVVMILTFLFIFLPLLLRAHHTTLKGTGSLFIFFSAIGFGFMLVEISQMQRLIVFLGHPTYGLSVVLFSLLLSGGLGSYTTQRVDVFKKRSSVILRFVILLCVLAAFGIWTPHAIQIFKSFSTTARIFISVLMLFPLGLLMGMAFPLGMKVASAKAVELTPWFWGMNGAASVSASVIAVVIAMVVGISASFWAGFLCYSFAVISYVRANHH